MKPFTITTPKGKRTIGPGHRAFIVAEMSANHSQNFETAVHIIKSAATAGADAIKLQTYTPDTLTLNSDKVWFRVGGEKNPKQWQGKTLYELYKEAYTPWEWHKKLQVIAHDHGLAFFSTPFDNTAVDFLESLHVPLYKIASYELTHTPLLKYVAATKKPVIMSVGFATKKEIDYAVLTLRKSGAKNLALLHCLTSYAKESPWKNANLQTMIDLAHHYKVISGFSDNNAGVDLAVQAVMLGASIIEKHIVVSHTKNALDSAFSLDAQEFKNMVDAIRRAEIALGRIQYGVQTKEEEYNRRFRRSIFAAEKIKKGEKFTTKNIRVVRPAFGLDPRFYEELLGKSAAKDIEKATPLTQAMITKEKAAKRPQNH